MQAFWRDAATERRAQLSRLETRQLAEEEAQRKILEVRLDPVADDYAQVTVADTGTGIPAHQLSQVFEPFEQGDSVDGRSREGTGLGLSIARRLVDLMGGTLEVSSQEGQGSVFSLTLPRPAGEPQRTVVSSQQPLGPQVSIGTVLYIEDDQADTDTMRALILASAEATSQDPDGRFRSSHRVVADHPGQLVGLAHRSRTGPAGLAGGYPVITGPFRRYVCHLATGECACAGYQQITSTRHPLLGRLAGRYLTGLCGIKTTQQRHG